MSKYSFRVFVAVLLFLLLIYFHLWKFDSTTFSWKPRETLPFDWSHSVQLTDATSGNMSVERELMDGPKSDSEFKTVPPLLQANHTASNITNSWQLMPDLKTSNRYFMVIIVKSAVSLFKRRQMIRSTWGSVRSINGKKFAVVFIVGRISNETMQKKLMQESWQFKDILQSNVSDEYSALPEKVLSAFQWVTFDLKNVTDFYAFTDDDCVINLPLTYDYFSTNKDEFMRSNAMHCAFMYSALIGPERTGRYAISDKTYPWGYLPAFCHGGFTVLTQQLMVDLYQQAQVTKRYDLHLEDVYIFGVLRTKLGRGNDNIKMAYADEKQGKIKFFMGPFVWHLGNHEALFHSAWKVVFNLMNVTTSSYEHVGFWPSSQRIRAELSNEADLPQDLDIDEFFARNFASLVYEPPVGLSFSEQDN